MKPFKINRASWHYKLNAKFMPTERNSDVWEYKHNNFCAYWRSTVLRMILISFFALSIGAFLFMLGSLIYVLPIEALKFLAFLLGAVIVVIFIMWLQMFLKDRKEQARILEKPESLFLQKYRAHKQKICPAVDFED